MARFRRWYRRRYGRRSWNRFRRYRRRYRRFANGSSRSRVRIKVPVQFNVSLVVPATKTESNVMTVCPFFDNETHTEDTLSEAAVRGGLTTSALFTNYANLYDSFKCDGMKVAVSITSPVGVGADAFPSLAVYTAWDRSFQRNDFDTAAHYPTVEKMRASSSFLASTALNNSITKLNRSCYASDLFEKGSFIDCSHQTFTTNIAGVAGESLEAFTSTQNQIAYPAFCPCFMFGVDTGSSVDLVTKRPVNLVVEVMYYITFRNPKYGGAAASAKVDSIARSVHMDGGDIDGDDGMLDVDPLQDEDSAAQASADPPRRSVLSKAPKSTHASRVIDARKAARQRRLADEEPPTQNLNE